MFSWLFRKEQDRAEAERALQETRASVQKAQRRHDQSRSLYDTIAEIRRRNHIQESVREIMEGR